MDTDKLVAMCPMSWTQPLGNISGSMRHCDPSNTGNQLNSLCSQITSRCAKPLGNVPNPVLFRPPTKRTYMHPWRYFYLLSPNGSRKIAAFFIKRANTRGTILFSHDGSEDLGMTYDELKAVSAVLHLNVMAYDYTGYGYSTGGAWATEHNCYENIDTAYKHLVHCRNICPEQIILVGRGIGNGPT